MADTKEINGGNFLRISRKKMAEKGRKGKSIHIYIYIAIVRSVSQIDIVTMNSAFIN